MNMTPTTHTVPCLLNKRLPYRCSADQSGSAAQPLLPHRSPALRARRGRHATANLPSPDGVLCAAPTLQLARKTHPACSEQPCIKLTGTKLRRRGYGACRLVTGALVCVSSPLRRSCKAHCTSIRKHGGHGRPTTALHRVVSCGACAWSKKHSKKAPGPPTDMRMPYDARWLKSQLLASGWSDFTMPRSKQQDRTSP